MRIKYTRDYVPREAYNCWFAPDGQWRAEICPFEDQVIENPNQWMSHHIIRGKTAVIYIVSMLDDIDRKAAVQIATAIVQGKVKKCLIDLSQ